MFFSNLRGANVEKHGEIILESEDISKIYNFIIRNFESAKKQIDYIINSKDPEYNFKFIINLFDKCQTNIIFTDTGFEFPIEYINQIKKHANAILESEDIIYYNKFAKWFSENRNLKMRFSTGSSVGWNENIGALILGSLDETLLKMQSTIIKKGSGKDNYEFFCHMKKLPVDFEDNIDYAGFSKAIVEGGEALENYLFAAYRNNGVDVKKHGKAVIKSKNPEYNYLFAKDRRDADIKGHGKAVIRSKNLEYNYLFAQNIAGADVLAHGEVIIKSKDPEYNYWFAKDIAGADVLAHSKAVVESKSPKYNFDFMRIAGALVDEHRRVILDSKIPEYNYELAKQDSEHELYNEHYQAVLDSNDAGYIAKLEYLKPNQIKKIEEKIKILKI